MPDPTPDPTDEGAPTDELIGVADGLAGPAEGQAPLTRPPVELFGDRPTVGRTVNPDHGAV